MTYEHYLAWHQFVTQKIAEQLNRFSMVAGNNANVIVDDIGVAAADVVEDEDTQPEPTWRYVVYGTILTEETNQTFGPAVAAQVLRTSNILLNDGLFVQSTQTLDFPEVLTRSKKVTYNVTTLEPDQIGVASSSGDFSAGIYRGGLKLTCLFYQRTTDGQDIFVRNYTLFVGRAGDSVTLVAPETNKDYYLRIVSVERL